MLASKGTHKANVAGKPSTFMPLTPPAAGNRSKKSRFQGRMDGLSFFSEMSCGELKHANSMKFSSQSTANNLQLVGVSDGLSASED